MSDTNGLRLWMMRGAFVGVTLLILLGNLLPLQTLPRSWAGPDLVLCFALIWSVRRPEFVPTPMLAILFLLADFLLSRPPGLAAALMLVACANTRTRSRAMREAGFAAEWTRSGILICLVALCERLILGFLLVPVPQLSLSMFQVVTTVLCYPIMVAVSAFVFGIRSAGPREVDAFGN